MSSMHLEIRRTVLDQAYSLGPWRAVLVDENGDLLGVSCALTPEEAMSMAEEDSVLWDTNADHLAAARRVCWVVVRRVG